MYWQTVENETFTFKEDIPYTNNKNGIIFETIINNKLTFERQKKDMWKMQCNLKHIKISK